MKKANTENISTGLAFTVSKIVAATVDNNGVTPTAMMTAEVIFTLIGKPVELTFRVGTTFVRVIVIITALRGQMNDLRMNSRRQKQRTDKKLDYFDRVTI